MKRPAPQTLAAIGVLVLLGLVAMLTSRNDKPSIDSYASTDYHSGGYRAWATLLAREGIVTSRFVLRPIELDDRVDTLISAQPPPAATDPMARTAADVAALAAWVRRGGQLVYVGRNAALGDVESRLLHVPFLVPNVGGRGKLVGPLADRVRAVYQLGADRMLFVEQAGQVLLSDRNGDLAVRYPLGGGQIVAVVDSVPFTNQNIARADNARLAYLVGLPRRTGGVVAFDDGLHGALIDRPWYRALPIAVRVALAFAGLALVLGLIASALPGSPPMRLQPAREPSSVEFVDALAALYERTAARAAARTILVRDALAAAAHSVGRGDEEVARLVARFADPVLAARIDRLIGELDAAPPVTDSDLLASAKLAYSVRKECLHGGNGDRRRAAFAGRPRARRRWE